MCILFSSNLVAQPFNAGTISFGTPTGTQCEIKVPVMLTVTNQFVNVKDMLVSCTIHKNNGDNDVMGEFSAFSPLLPSSWFDYTENLGDDNAQVHNISQTGGPFVIPLIPSFCLN